MSDLEQKRREVRQRLIDENEFPHIPEDWGVERLRFLFTESKERNGKSPVGEMLSVSEYRGVVPREYESEEQKRTNYELENYRIVRPGQLAVNSMWLNHLGLGVSEHTGHVSPAYNVYKISDRLDRRFVHHLMRSNYYLKIYLRYLYGIRPNSLQIKSNDWTSIPIIVPDLATQRRIADFLDCETARIDLLIEKKQRLVALLAGKRETVRDTAVCKGLSNAAETKDSGVDWFGDVPSHWTVCRFNRLIASKVDYRGRTPEKVDDGVFLVTARNIRNGKIDYERSKEYTTAEDWEKLSARGKPRIGDVIFTTEAPLGQIAQVDRTDVAFAQRIMKFRANSALVSNDYLTQFMMSASFQRSLQLYASGSTAEGIKSERLAHLSGLVPPKEEQSQIVGFVRQEIDKLNALVEPINTSIVRLKEYRSALITAAVTGQIDVKTYARSGTTDRRLDAIQEGMGA